VTRSLFPTTILVGLLSGCSDNGPATAPVDGVVTFAGKPVPFAMVVFLPQNAPDGQPGYAQTDADGKFSNVSTAGKSTNGVVVGTHFVTVTEAWPPDKEIPVDEMGMQKTPPRGVWGQKYRDSSNPALKVEVVGGKNNHFGFDLSK